ncbi:hypothetical protein PG994_007281 [Apiospora phragmitis]|uniref:Probable dipeptidyl-aminopeptidase B n=1 Tax=Apiospora phragmitis TaxID=2905665 RepID=A0ABR1V0G7_9PEZI
MKIPSLPSLLLVGSVIFDATLAIEPARQPHQPLGNGDKLITFNETVVSSAFRASSQSIDWLSGGEDGQFIYQDDSGALVLENFVTGESSTFVAADAIPKGIHDYTIRPDLKKVLFSTNYKKQYRHSFFADYSVLDVESGEILPLVADQDGDIQYAEFAPVGETIAFVRGNDLFLNTNGTVTQVTEDGGPDLFHAVPDWVYEEEIFGDRKTFWFSPNGMAVVFLSFNETGVETFTIPYYMDGQPVAPSYPEKLELRYPKVGSKNPTVSLTLLDVETGKTQPVEITAYAPDDLVIGEVTWLTDTHDTLAYRAFNRVQDQSKHVKVAITAQFENLESTVIRERDGTDGWLENTLLMQYVGKINGTGSWYLDVSDESGWQHIYLYPAEGGEGIAVTSGEWEVVSILKVDTAKELIYYTSTEKHSTERHLYFVSYATLSKKPLRPGRLVCFILLGGGYYILSYQGPDVPYQELYSINSTEPIRVITSNEALLTKFQDYNLPNITYFSLDHPSGFRFNVMERLPPKFDPSKTYPVLFIPYGGPGAQEVSKSFKAIDWKAYITSDPELQYITYTVDGRGTGYKGREFRSTVTAHLGKLEAQDQIWVAQQLAESRPYIDASKIGIQGWSFGGYLSSKVIEADSGVFSHALIVAPVSDWRFYDSMYTERYMKVPSTNEAGYNETAVRKPEGFRNIAGRFAIYHGTGDDNVHYQNSAALIDLVVGAGISPQKMDWQSFTDSDHSINYHGANPWLYRHMTDMLYQEKHRTSQGLVHQWSRRGEETKV